MLMKTSITPDNADLFDNPDKFRQLWALVLQRAIDDVLLQKAIRTDSGNKNGRHKNSAYRWIFVNESAHINSFQNVCLILDLDPDRVRSKVMEIIKQRGLVHG